MNPLEIKAILAAVVIVVVAPIDPLFIPSVVDFATNNRENLMRCVLLKVTFKTKEEL